MIRFKKRNRAVSPVVATVILISLVLAGTAIVLLVVMPMLNTGPEPNLVLLNENSFKDYDNDGLCDYMSLQIQNVIGGTNANITGVSVIWVDGEEAKDVKWEPLNEKDSLITEGSTQKVEFIASFDDLSEVASGAEIAILIISSESSHSLLEVTNPILVTTGEKVIVTFEDGSEVPITGANIDFYKATGEYAYSGEPTNSIGRSESYLFPGHYKARASKDFAFHYSAEFTHPDNIGPIKIKVVGGTLTVKVKSVDTPIEGAITYVYDTFGHYLSKNSVTNSDGICTFSLDNGNYKFRADVSGITYYSEDVTFPDQTYVEIDTGGGDIYCRVIDGGDNPIPNVRVYLFRASGSYFGRYANTNATGLAFFPNVPGGTLFKFRVDYLAYRLWSQEFGASHGSVIDVNVGGGTIYVNVTDGSGFPIQNTRTYLFTESGSYSGKWSNTNDTGIATYERDAAGW
ncbi:MAG: carboxypeptidase regulatory-like domain-containing protein, partial [Candidatus Heimdallarchaeota archaeon]|nr:carboxypeptidase regulatory-like domain-containing protein [Candidatus Heimdallarchaeota archaeon]MCK4253980.1 carboxypeptidase regulatory-like domain-containing protein [Candidatus Heimdallarchaeota archaeon]